MATTTEQNVFDFAKRGNSPALAREKALLLLPYVLALRNERTDGILADFRNGFASGWKMAAGEFFRDALDIKITGKQPRWTQGNLFAFSPGDIVYDTPEAYEGWETAFPRIKTCFQIREAQAVAAQTLIVRFAKTASFGRSFGEKPQLAERRRELFKFMPKELTLLTEINRQAREETGKNVSPNLLDALVDIGAVRKVEEVIERKPGQVAFDVLVPDSRTKKLKFREHRVVTQDEFVERLIAGLPKE